jgi:CRISPR-associated protein Cas1
VESGTLHFVTKGFQQWDAGDYAIPYQAVSMILLGPGSSLTHDVLRLCARHGTLIAAVGDNGLKFYSAPPQGQSHSDVARAHARIWADAAKRLDIARAMYTIRFGESFPERDIAALRGMEGGRLRETYRIIAQQYHVPWHGRHYDRQHPEDDDIPNQAINHAATFVEAAAEIAVAAVGALPPLGFIHEDASNAFVLDIADLWRATMTLPLAFSVAARFEPSVHHSIERTVRLEAARRFQGKQVIATMIDQVKELLHVDDASRHA